MSTLPDSDDGETLREHFARLIDEAKAYVRAEIALVKQTALGWVDKAKFGVAFIAVAVMLLQAALVVFVGALGMLLAIWLGTAGGLAVGALIAVVIAGLLGWAAARQFSGAGK